MEIHDPNVSTPMPGNMGKDFLALFDVAPDATPFGKLGAMLPVGKAARLGNQTSYAMPPNDVLYTNDWLANQTYVFDHDPSHPGLLRKMASVGPYMYLHSFVYLSNGNTLATSQYANG